MCMKSIAVLTLGLTVAGLLASAQELTKQAKIERILVLTKADAMMDQMFGQIKAMTESQLPSGATAEQRAKAQEIQGKIMDLVKARMSWDKMRPQYVKIYDEIYSEEEIDGILVFYQSSVGRAMLEKMPLVISKTMTLAQSQMGGMMPEIQRIVKEAEQR
jgi:hypothetical protein